MYEALIMVDPSEEISVSSLKDELERFYCGSEAAPSKIIENGQNLSLKWGNYCMHVHRSSLLHVQEESAKIADQFASRRPDRDRIKKCQIRFELSADDDPEMQYFNDYLFVGEALERLGKVYRFDQASGEFD